MASGSTTNADAEIQINGSSSQAMNMTVNTSNLERGVAEKGKREKSMNNKSDGLSRRFVSSASTFPSERDNERTHGSGKRKRFASLGESITNSAGQNFIPRLVTVHTGEDLMQKLLSIPKPLVFFCILSAHGGLSRFTICHSGGFNHTTYEGAFEICSLSGSFHITEKNGVRGKSGRINMLVASRDGRVFGGEVEGPLVAARPIQVVLASFTPDHPKAGKRKCDRRPSSSMPRIAEADTNVVEENQQDPMMMVNDFEKNLIPVPIEVLDEDSFALFQKSGMLRGGVRIGP